ncbi:TPA: tail fiber assembly protein [Serratia marcescens]
MIFFSEKTMGFYPTSVISKERYEVNNSWPDDAIEISHADYEKYIAVPPVGMMLGSESGRPTWVSQTPPDKNTSVQIATIKKNQLMADAGERISLLERAVRLSMATEAEKVQLEDWERYSVILNRVNPSDAPEITWPELPN